MFTYNKNISLSNTAWINTELAANDVANRVFKSYADAVTYIQANGNVSASNQWQIILGGGITPLVTVYDYIKIAGIESTVINELRSESTFTGSLDFIQSAYISGVQIQNLNLGAGKVLAITNSIIQNATEQESQAFLAVSDCIIQGGNYTNVYWVLAKNLTIFAINSAITIDSSFDDFKAYNTEIENTANDVNIIGGNEVTFKNSSYILLNSITGNCQLISCASVSIETITGNLEASNCGGIEVTEITGDVNISNCQSFTAEIKGSDSSFISFTKVGGCSFNKTAGSVFIYNSIVQDNTIASAIGLQLKNCVRTGTITDTGGGGYTTDGNDYSNASSGLTANETNAAIDELKALIDAL